MEDNSPVPDTSPEPQPLPVQAPENLQQIPVQPKKSHGKIVLIAAMILVIWGLVGLKTFFLSGTKTSPSPVKLTSVPTQKAAVKPTDKLSGELEGRSDYVLRDPELKNSWAGLSTYFVSQDEQWIIYTYQTKTMETKSYLANMLTGEKKTVPAFIPPSLINYHDGFLVSPDGKYVAWEGKAPEGPQEKYHLATIGTTELKSVGFNDEDAPGWFKETYKKTNPRINPRKTLDGNSINDSYKETLPKLDIKGYIGHAEWSKDGKKVVFTEIRSGEEGRFWIADGDGGNMQLIAKHTDVGPAVTDGRWPSPGSFLWSADDTFVWILGNTDKSIASTGDRAGNLYVYQIANKSLKSAGLQQPVYNFSPDVAWAVLYPEDTFGNKIISVINLKTKEVKNFTFASDALTGPWSEDSTYLSFNSTEGFGVLSVKEGKTFQDSINGAGTHENHMYKWTTNTRVYYRVLDGVKRIAIGENE